MPVGAGAGVLAGFKTLTTQCPEKFDMILSKDNPHYKDLPGLAVLLGGMWMMNVSYWGFNQYIIQRGLAAKNIEQAQGGVLLAAFLIAAHRLRRRSVAGNLAVVSRRRVAAGDRRRHV